MSSVNQNSSAKDVPYATQDQHAGCDLAEIPLAPRRRDLSFYLILILVVGPLWSVVPLSWGYVIHTLWTGKVWTLSWKASIGFTAALCEVFFSVWYHQLARHVSGPPPNPPGNTLELQAAFGRVLQAGLASLPEGGFDEETLHDERPGSPAETLTQLEPHDPRAIDFRNSLRTWFGKIPWSHIRVREMHAWLYWSIFNAHLPSFETLPSSHRSVLEDAVKNIEMRSGTTIPHGSNPSIKPLLLTLDPVNVAFRPLAWYIFVAASNQALRVWFKKKWGARFGSYKSLEYMLRVPQGYDPRTGPLPIVFIHGLGLGLAQYKLFLSHLLRALPDRPLLVPVQPHISQDIFHPRFLKPMGRHEMADVLVGLIDELGWSKEEDESSEPEDNVKGERAVKVGVNGKSSGRGVTVLSHSNGSYTHAWLLKAHSKTVVRSCFVDPVTFCSWEGDVCYNFIYRPPMTGMELIMRYFVGTELGVANLLQRHFDWSSNSLWYEEIPNARDLSRTRFFLGGRDAIVNAERVQRYLRSHGIRKGLWCDPEGRHGQALLAGGEGHREIIRWLREPIDD